MVHQLRNAKFYFFVAADVVLFTVSLMSAAALRFNLAIPPDEVHRLTHILPWVLAVKALLFFLMDAYRGMWRYTSLHDAKRVTEASLLAMAVVMAGLAFYDRFNAYSRSVFIGDAICTIVLCLGARATVRLAFARWHRSPAVAVTPQGTEPMHRRRLLVVGAGDAADKFIREIQGNAESPYQIVACVDDDAQKHGLSLLGIPIYGPIGRLAEVADLRGATEIVIAMPSVAGTRMREVAEACKATGLPFRILPSLSSLIDGRARVDDLRPVDFEDLLGRPEVRLELDRIGGYLTGKVVAVTGAGGSIGSELCRQVLRFNPAAVVLIDGSEYNLYQVEMELRALRRPTVLSAALGRVQDRPLMERIFARYRPQVVFHAAAYKHVPMVEANPWEGVFNNVIGSQVIMDVAEAYGAERFVQVSTDKAVRPTNVMGATKRMAEILLQSRTPGRTRFMAVRFGNVLGSSGSVIPLFQKQIKAGGPVTVTHPEMTRYFMTIPEASRLILQAGAMGEGGEIFILEMGTPVRIADMARDLIRLSGKEPGRDIGIEYTGLRPGEKLYEELITHGEGIVGTPHEKIMVLRREGHRVAPEIQAQRTRQVLETLVRTARLYDAEQMRKVLRDHIPEYSPSQASSVLSVSPEAERSMPGPSTAASPVVVAGMPALLPA